MHNSVVSISLIMCPPMFAYPGLQLGPAKHGWGPQQQQWRRQRGRGGRRWLRRRLGRGHGSAFVTAQSRGGRLATAEVHGQKQRMWVYNDLVAPSHIFDRDCSVCLHTDLRPFTLPVCLAISPNTGRHTGGTHRYQPIPTWPLFMLIVPCSLRTDQCPLPPDDRGVCTLAWHDRPFIRYS